MKTITMTTLFLLGLASTAQADLYFQVGDQAEYVYTKADDALTATAVIVHVKDVNLQTITFEASVQQADGSLRTCETTLQRQDLIQGDVSATGCTGIDLMLPSAARVVENRPESVVTDAGEFLSEYTKYQADARQGKKVGHETWVSQEVPLFGVVKQNRGAGTLSLKSFQISQ